MNADSGWKVELLLGCHDNPIKWKKERTCAPRAAHL
jgi:hypothetical protein